MLVNSSQGRDPRSEPARPDQFDPWAAADRARAERRAEPRREGEEPFVPIEVLGTAWVDQQQRG